MKTNKILCLVIAALLMCALAACDKSGEPGGDGNGGTTNLSGSPAEILEALLEDTKTVIEDAGGFMYMSILSDVTADVSQDTAGLSRTDFGKYAVAASSSMAAISSQAHQIILIQAKDAASAAQVKKLVAGRVAGSEGYDPLKWVCVWPEQCVTVDSGEYVLIIASRKDIVEAALAVFGEMAGSVGDADFFYEHME